MFNRSSPRSLLIEINPYQILAAGVSRPDQGPALLDCAAEFEREDDAGLRRWLDEHFDKQKNWVPAIGGFAPPDGLLQRESILPRKLAEPGYLEEMLLELYKVESPGAWKLQTLSPLEGTPIAPEGTQRPALICGVSHSDVHQMQQRLLDHRLLPYRLELGLLPLFGAISHYKAQQGDKRAVVIVVIEQEHTAAYILGKEGVQTPAPVRHGFSSIVQAARKEFNLTDAQSVRERLHLADEELLLRATKFVRAIGRDLKPVVDSFEMTTGQPIGELYCAYLPPQLSWIAEPLTQVVGRTTLNLDCAAWLPSVNLQTAPEVPPLGPHWMGALSLLAEIPGAKPEKAGRESAVHPAPWHVDYRISAELPSGDLVRRRFLANVVAITLASAALMATFWQFYAGYALTTDIAFWEQRMKDDSKPFAQVNQLTRELATQTARLDAAYELAATPFPVSEFMLNLGRTRPAPMQIDAITSTEGGVSLRGIYKESSQQASRSLRSYVEELRRDPTIAPLFTSIALTSLDRESSTDTLAFVITFRTKAAQP